MATGGLSQASYLFKKDPGVLIDYSKEAKTCQINQKRRQIMKDTYSQYVE